MDAKKESTSKQESTEPPLVVEEKISKVGGDPQIRKYNRGKLLGKGGFAKCYEMTNPETKKLLAGKIIVKSTLTKSRTRQKLISEIKIHKSMRHSNIVGFEHVFEDTDYVYILLELCPNQSLHDLIKRRKRLTEVETQCYVVQLVSALKYLHSHRVIHRDLKLGNLFLNDKMELKLGDFGLASKLEFEGERRRTVCGTPNYIAPEIIEGKVGHSYEVDIWSLGVIIYALLVGRPPFETPDVKLTYKKIKACNYSFPDHVTISDTAKSLITRILNLEPSKRPTLDEILQHPFINNGGTIPKLLPVSTLTVPPSASYLRQFLPSGTSKAPLETKQFTETAPFGFAKTGKLISATKAGSERNLLTKDSSPTLNAPTYTQNGGETAATSNQIIERQSSKGAEKPWALTKTGTFQSSALSTQTLKSVSRPFSQQNDFRSSQKFRSTQSGSNFGAAPAVTSSSTTGALTGSSRGVTPVANGEVWVKKWVDYSSKYGLGYILSNGISGVYFNDNTKIILETETGKFDYIEKNGADRQDVITPHHINDYPKELQKKVTLLQHFRKYLDGNEKEPMTFEEDPKQAKVYVKKWLKTKYAMMFRLSNKIVQMNFSDKTEIILSSEHKMVTYLNKKGERSNYPLATALESPNTDMTKRLKYTKEVLTHMLGDNHLDRMPTLQY